MKNTNIILPLGIFAAMLLSACGKNESAPQPDNSRRDMESSTRAEAPQGSDAETAATKKAGSSTLTSEKPLPKLVPVKSFSQQSTEQGVFSQSTMPVSAGGYGTSVTIIQNAAPQVQGTAAPAPESAPKKPATLPVYGRSSASPN